MSGGTTGMPKAVVGPHRCLVAAGLQLSTWLHPPKGAPQDIALVPLPLFHVYACVGVQSHSIISRTPMALVPNPRDIDDLLKTIKTVRPTLFSAVPALFIALLNHPKVKRQVGRLQLDSRLLLRRGAADGRDEDAVRGAHGRPNRRRLLADRSDDGVHRQSAERRRTRPDRWACRFPTSKSRLSMPRLDAVPAERRDGRNHHARAATDGRLLQQRGGDDSRAARSSSTPDGTGSGPGCTRETSATSTRIRTCSSSIARRT